MGTKISKESINLRFNILTLFIYLVGVILLVQLFNLQIINGESYREQSNTRLSRESKIEAARGSILDRTGTALATSDMGFDIQLYKTKVDTEVLNDTLLNLTNLLEENSISYTDTFPIKIDPFEFTISNDTLTKWKDKYKIDEDATAEQAFYEFKDKYDISTDNIKEIRQIIAIRYAITTNGYSSTKSLNIAKNVSRDVIAKLSEKSSDYPGIDIVTTSQRSYTSGSLASHILGYIGVISSKEYEQNKDNYSSDDMIGKTGIEYVFEEYLKGKNGIKQVDMAVDGTVTAEYTTEEAEAGANVILTIDSTLQKVTEQSLKANIDKINSGGFSIQYNATGGSVVVINVKTGEILAMASYPDFEPQKFVNGISSTDWNNYVNDTRYPLLNKAIQSSYAPGSIFKMVTATAALESGVIGINDKVNDVGVYDYYDYHPKCWYYTEYHRGHGYLNVSDAIKHSCNYYFYEVANRMGIDTIEKYARYYGLGDKTGVELPSETTGVLASKTNKKTLTGEEWQGGETLSAAIGQSLNSFSPMQMAKYIGIVANGGELINPTIVKSVVKPDGTTIANSELENYVNNKLGITNSNQTSDIKLNQENLKAILEGMRSVTNETGGTAYSIFKNFNIEVGGKTGSAEAGSNVNAWFAGFAPFNNPEIAVVVMVENGGHGYYTAEVARDIMAQYFGMNANTIYEDLTAKSYTESVR